MQAYPAVAPPSDDKRWRIVEGTMRRHGRAPDSLIEVLHTVQEAFGFDFADSLSPDQWICACRVFQKRHLLAHKMGVIDADYLQKANDPGAVVARKLRVTHDEVNSAISVVEVLARRLFAGVLPPAP